MAGGGHDTWLPLNAGSMRPCARSRERRRNFRHSGKAGPIAQSSSRFTIPVWAVGSIAADAAGRYVCRPSRHSWRTSDAAAASLVAVHPAGEVNIQRLVPRRRHRRRRQRCSGSVSALESRRRCRVSKRRRASSSASRTCPLFDPLDTKLKDSFKPDIARVAQVLERQPGAIKIVGHTDDMPVKTARFSSNFQLSVERAKAVTALIKPALSQPNGVEASGQGADVPIASNSTPEGRAANRRIEIIIKRTN